MKQTEGHIFKLRKNFSFIFFRDFVAAYFVLHLQKLPMTINYVMNYKMSGMII